MRVISGKKRGAKLASVESEDTRPTLDRTKETMFNLIPAPFYDKVVLDLFSGSGALGIEALSRGAGECHFVDSSTECTKMIHKNLEHTGLNELGEIHTMDVQKSIEWFTNRKIFDIIFLDPPYNMGFINSTLNSIIKAGILNQNGLVVLEAGNKEEIRQEELRLLKSRRFKISTLYLYTLYK